jgi:hypothetical protein
MSDAVSDRLGGWGDRLRRNRLVRFVVLFVGLIAIEVAAGVASQILGKQHPASKSAIALSGMALGALAALLLYAIIVRWMERRPVRELTLSAAPGGLLAGILVGAALFASVIGALTFLGNAAVTVPATLVFPTIACALAILAGVIEELVFRGALFRLVEERFGTLVALVLSAAVFGALHAFNHGATWVSTIAVALEPGVLLALAYAATRTLWFTIGLHFAWNFTEGGIFTAVVSGGHVPGLLKTTLSGPDLLTGGTFGPEASVVAVAICLAAAAVLFAITLRRAHWRPLSRGTSAP